MQRGGGDNMETRRQKENVIKGRHGQQSTKDIPRALI